MKKLTAVIAMVLSLGAFAVEQEVNFTYFGNEEIGTRSYHNCDSVESSAKSILKKLGATDISVRCTGGLDVWSRMALPVNLRASFNTPVVTGESYEIVKLRGDNCGLETRMIKSFLKVFTNIEVLKERSNCGMSRATYSFELKVGR